MTTVTRVGDASAQWFALSFARAYLTWSADLSAHERALSPFLAAGNDPDAGLTPAAGDAEQVSWLAITGEKDRDDGEHDYTVAAGMTDGTVRYVGVALGTGAGGAALVRYPALVGAPTPRPATDLDGAHLPVVTNSAVVAVLDRALGNYVGSSPENLAADLAPGALVDPAAPGLSLRNILRLAVEPSGNVLATLIARDAVGDEFTLAYELSLRELSGRWEITRIEP